MHRRPLELAAAAVDFELSAHEREELDRHLAACSLCRGRIAGFERDARAIGVLPILPVSAAQSARLRVATLRRPDGPAWSSLRLIAVATIVALLALAAVAVGSSLVDRDRIDLSVVEPVPSTVVPAPVAPSLPPSLEPSSPPPSESPDAEPAGYQPPAPSCPAPTEQVPPPTIEMNMGDGEIVFTPTVTSQLVTTCSSVQPSDFAEAEPQESVEVLEGQTIDVVLPPRWDILHWEGFDRPQADEGDVHLISGETREDGPSTITVPVPNRTGDVVLGVTVWTQTANGRVIATVSTVVRLDIRDRESGGFPSAVPGVLSQGLANVGCDSVGWPEDVPEFSTLTFRMDAEDPGYVTARSDTGARVEVLWEGDQFRVGSDSVLDTDGAVVVEDGDAIDVPSDGSLPRLGDYSICLNPQRLIVFVPD